MSSLEKYKITKSDERNNNGINKKVMAFVSGEKVMIKSNDGTIKESLTEYFAYTLGTALGLKVNKVQILDCGDLLGFREKICSAHWWEQKLIVAKNYDKHSSEYDNNIKRFFDSILSNEDRNMGNYGFIEDTGELFLIDHGLSYPWMPFCEGDENDLKHSAKKLKEHSQKFLSFTEDDFRNFLQLPEEIKKVYDSDTFDNIIERMKQAQRIIKEAV